MLRKPGKSEKAKTVNIAVKDLAHALDKRKHLEYGEILIEFKDDKAAVHYVNDAGLESELIDAGPEGLDNIGLIRAMCRVAWAVREAMFWDASKHASWRFSCGASPNSDETRKELEKILAPEIESKLFEAGYEVVKTNLGD